MAIFGQKITELLGDTPRTSVRSKSRFEIGIFSTIPSFYLISKSKLINKIFDHFFNLTQRCCS